MPIMSFMAERLTLNNNAEALVSAVYCRSRWLIRGSSFHCISAPVGWSWGATQQKGKIPGVPNECSELFRGPSGNTVFPCEP